MKASARAFVSSGGVWVTLGCVSELEELVTAAWAEYDRAHALPLSALVRPSIPILFFGDYERYAASPLRVVTVGLNPSRLEFPTEAPFARFPAAGPPSSERLSTTRYVAALSDYFRIEPYSGWFKPAFESMLQGMSTSYYDGARGWALHTDICSPLATDPTWSGLGPEREALEREGVELWHRLVRFLRPDVILISVARRHLDKIHFLRQGDLKTIHRIDRKNPFDVQAAAIDVGAPRLSLLVFGQAANLPFGTVSAVDKRTIGDVIATELTRLR